MEFISGTRTPHPAAHFNRTARGGCDHCFLCRTVGCGVLEIDATGLAGQRDVAVSVPRHLLERCWKGRRKACRSFCEFMTERGIGGPGRKHKAHAVLQQRGWEEGGCLHGAEEGPGCARQCSSHPFEDLGVSCPSFSHILSLLSFVTKS